MGRMIVAALVVALTWLPAPVMAQSVSAQSVDPAVEACLRANAARVSAQAASLVDAAEFLLSNVCAVESANVYARAQQARMERMRARLCQNNEPTAAALQSDPGDDDDTGAFMRSYCAEGSAWSGEGIEEAVSVMGSMAAATPADRALAAQLILEARAGR